MRMPGSAIALAVGFMLSGCEGALNDLPGNNQDSYAAPGYYTAPGYVIPYAYQPDYAEPYPYASGWQDHDHWREHEWRERREHAFENEDRPRGQRYQGAQPSPSMAGQPRGSVPAAPPPASPLRSPSAATPQVDQNKRLLDQLGFRPSR